MDRGALPVLALDDPGFSTRGADVLAAREAAWCARTPWGLAVLRHAEAGAILRDRRFRQGSHAWPRQVGLSGPFARFWASSVIGQEGAAHKRLRRAAMAALSEDYVLGLKPQFHGIAEALLDGVEEEAFDFVGRISQPFAGRAVTALMGLDEGEAEWIAADASRLGLAMGLDAARHETEIDAACTRLFALAGRLVDAPVAASYPARLIAAGEDLTRDEIENLIVISIFGGVDTTRAQLAFAVGLFIRHLDQWAWLRENREAVPKAIDEVIRTWPTTTWSTREALEDVEVSGVRIAAGETVHVLVHATATDPRAVGVHAFDMRQRRKVHFGFGGGAHNCLGQFVARTDMAEMLTAMLDRWVAIRWAGEPVASPDSGNTHPERWPVAPVWA